MLLLIALLPALAAAFVRAPRVASSPLVLTATRLEDRPVLGFLVEALAPLKETPSEGYARSPPRWMKPASASQLRKTHRSQHRHWFSDDLAHDFNRKHGVHAQPLAMRETLSKAETLAPFNESPLSLIEAVNKYLADALVEGVAPLGAHLTCCS